jgi:hypothetical protein
MALSREVPWRFVARRTAVLSRGRHIVEVAFCFAQLVAAWRTPPFPCNAHPGTVLYKKPEFLGLFLIYLLPRPAAPSGGGVTRGIRSAGTPPPTPADGAPPAGPWQELLWQFALQRLVLV